LKSCFGGLDGRLLREGDWLDTGANGAPLYAYAGSRLAGEPPVYLETEDVGILPGPQADWFREDSFSIFTGEEFTVSETSDRMAYRLQGAPVPRRGGDILSEGMVNGAVQVPPDGQPIVMMSERPTTGGYPKIATVIRADLPRLAHLIPGRGRVRFHSVTLEEAQAKLREQMSCLSVERDDQSLWMAG
jgi:allophanate hydrolase subunit 2